MSREARWAVMAALAVMTGAAAACGNDPGAAVERAEGTAIVTVGGETATQPIVCTGHHSFEASVATTDSGPGGYSVDVTLDSDTSATVKVTESVYKSSPIEYAGTAAVSLSSTSGPVGSLQGTLHDTGAAGGGGGGAGSLDVSARFQCTANGGGVYAADSSVDMHHGIALYFTVNHAGSQVVELTAAPQGSASAPVPNVQIHGTGIPIAADGRFSLTARLIAADPTGAGFAGQPATLLGRLDREGKAAGSITYPSGVFGGPVAWHAAIAGDIAVPVFPHGDLSTRLISASEVGGDPAINLLYPGSTNRDGSPPGRPWTQGETPQDQWANMDFARPSGGEPAEADREQVTPGSAYDVARWYTEHLLALGWTTGTTSNYGNEPGITFVDGNRLFVLSMDAGPYETPSLTDYRLILREAAQPQVVVTTGVGPGPPDVPFVPCAKPLGPATITVSGTVSGTAANLCSLVYAEDTPRCDFSTAGFVVGETRFVLWGPPYESNGLDITDAQLRIHSAAPAGTVARTVSGTTLHVHARYSGEGYDETVDLTTSCTP